MCTEDIIKSVSELIAENHQLQAKVERLESSRGFDVLRFYNVAMTTGEVAKFHGVSEQVVRKYVSLGLIELHPMSCDKKILVRASDALTLDFKDLKTKAKSL